MRRVAAGDPRAFRELSDAHLGAVLSYAYRLTGDRAEAEDIAQEVFSRAWQRAESYEPRARVTTWLHRIAHNLAIDVLRKRRGTQDFPTEQDELAAASSANPRRLLEEKHRALSVQAGLDLLPERQKQALILAHEQGLGNPEIAGVLGVGVEAVESLLARGRRRLRELLKPEHTAEETSHD